MLFKEIIAVYCENRMKHTGLRVTHCVVKTLMLKQVVQIVTVVLKRMKPHHLISVIAGKPVQSLKDVNVTNINQLAFSWCISAVRRIEHFMLLH
jgi:hypothetical protein